ncbi:MAG: site-specific DNA-methyltransferase [Planctomycetaceae bacterium]|nr:site-specific DNA-methyltransferase [Planctomycetaceae bacterium]
MGKYEIHYGDSLEILSKVETDRFNCCVTSPPYWGLRDYGHQGQLGMEPTPELYVDRLVSIFREVKRSLRPDGTLWLNLGDSYSGSGQTGGLDVKGLLAYAYGTRDPAKIQAPRRKTPKNLKPKNLVGIPWRVAFALQDDGWFLRSDIIWHKPNPMPESVTDRPTKAHEYVFLLSKSPRYYYDAAAIKTKCVSTSTRAMGIGPKALDGDRFGQSGNSRNKPRRPSLGRNKRSVWTVPTAPYHGAHFAVFPPSLIRPCILAGSPRGGEVLDPFLGSGTTARVSIDEGRRCFGVELNDEYRPLIEERLSQSVLWSCEGVAR